MKRSALSSILTKIGFYGQRNNVNAVEQAINAVVSRRQFMRQTQTATVMQNRIRKWFNLREQQRLTHEQQLQMEQEQLQKQRKQDINELKEEFGPELLDDEGIFDADKYRQQQHQLRAQEIEERKRKQEKDRQTRYAQLLDKLHNNEGQFNKIKNLALSRFNKDTSTLCISSLAHVDQLLDAVYRKGKGNIFKLAADLGVIIARANGNAQEQLIQYKYVLPVYANSKRKAPMEIRSQDNIKTYKQYLRTVIGSMQERTNIDAHEKIVAIFSIMFFAFSYPLAGAAIPSLKQHIIRREIYYVDYKDKRWKDSSRIVEAKRIINRVLRQEFHDNYKGFDFVNDFNNIIDKEQVNVHMYMYESDPPHYELTQNYLVNDSNKQFNILFINDGINAYIMYISDVEALTRFQLNKSEPCPIDAFDNQLRNKNLSDAKYQAYLIEASLFTNRWDYLKHYNTLDTRILIEPIDYLIDLMFKYKVDMLANILKSQCSNAFKYSMAYNDFDINGDYNSECTDKSNEIAICYWRAKVDSYNEQDNKKNRDSSSNVTINDYSYFKDVFKNQRCHMRNARFTWKNRPLIDRIDNKLGHSKDNVLPCCLYCNTCKANRDEKQMKLMIQLRKYALFEELPMTLISDDIYKILKRGITGGLSQFSQILTAKIQVQ
ncbi:MAG: hypothetical protein EZS28_018598 [Streblomastix strix]|uniref:HNH nuclease domain-containing protein n=1 Tax=Streblomastix strix TaxID=222440 RepID=A0A5J4VTX5_9EUKA|nr:MAG: hypothetical protein EZS28_018598 [Streblomastix strix]